MVTRLASGPATVNELAEPFDMSLQAVSKHLSAPALQEATRWLVDFRSFYIDSYERLDDLLEQHHPERKQP